MINNIKNYTNDDLNVFKALENIYEFLPKTPILESNTLNKLLNCRIYFKADSLQKTGAFKVRGVLNHLIYLRNINKLPEKLVAYSTGNHGIGVAWAAKKFGINARIYLPKYASQRKIEQITSYRAEVISTETRQIAEDRSINDVSNGYYYLHPSDSNTTIAGAGTVCLEALKQLNVTPDAIFVSCGGGGLVSGTYLAKIQSNINSKIIASEPLNANDASISKKNGKIFRFSNSPATVADGLKALSLSERTFNYIKQIDQIYEIPEKEIEYWTLWLMDLLKINIEPSSAINMGSVVRWIKDKTNPKILVIISGGNIDNNIINDLRNKNYLDISPNDFYKK